MFRSDFPFIIIQMHLYGDDHHGPHHEAVMAHEFCIAIDKNRFTSEEMCQILMYYINISGAWKAF